MAEGGAEGLDAAALRAEVERALGAMEDVRRIKPQLTNATQRDRRGAQDPRRTWPSASAAHLAQVDAIVAAGTGDDTPPQGTLV